MNYEQTIALYQPTLHAIAMRFLRCKADAEDVVQETFIKWLNAEHEKIQNTKAYLIRAVTNNCINHLNALKRKKEQYLENLQWPEFIEKLKDTDFSTLDFEAEVAKALHLVQEKLEPLERAVYLLKEVFDFDYQALQQLLNKKQDHCRQLLCRAKKKMNDERDNFTAAIEPRKTALVEAFKRACDFGQASELVNHLRQDVGRALSKK
ncbi:MAG TPA: sigma-70 family RNA polymerase sigma factor [Chryseosolibacter sp.]|nr:sigma-70 family RNA polymerase sigma factor [Chryseosolibacter sp.]